MNTVHREQLRASSMALMALGETLLRGHQPTHDLWVKDVPILEQATKNATITSEAWAAEHHRVMIREVHPFANVFLSRDAKLGGATTANIREDLHQMGLSLRTEHEECDHIGHLVIAMGHLVGAELDATEDQKPEVTRGLRQLQARVIDRHITPWLSTFSFAIAQQQSEFYTALVELTKELLITVRNRLDLSYAPATDFALPTRTTSLEEPDTDVRAIATLLTTPSLSGWYLSRGWLSMAAGRLDLPCGFGSRRLMMTNLMHTAIDHQRLADLMDYLLGTCNEWLDSMRQSANCPCPGWPEVSTVWIQRLCETESALLRIKSASQLVQLSES